MENASLQLTLESQLCYVVSPVEVVAHGEIEKFESMNPFQRLTMEIGGNFYFSLDEIPQFAVPGARTGYMYFPYKKRFLTGILFSLNFPSTLKLFYFGGK